MCGTSASGLFSAEGVWENSRSRNVTLTSSVPHPSSLKHHKTLMWEMPFLYQEERSILTSKDEETKISNKKTLLSCSSTFFTTITSYSLTHHTPPLLCTLHQTRHKILRSNYFFGSSLPYRFPSHVKFLLNKLICFSPVNLSV